MEELRRIAVEGLADLGPRGVVESRQPPEQPIELRLARLVPARAEPLDHGRRRTVVQITHEPLRFLVDDRERRREFALPALPVGRAGRGEIVDRVEPDARPLADPRIEVARHGQVEHDQRTPGASQLHLRKQFQRHDRRRGSRRAHHQVGGGEFR